jgi:DNA-binding FadR family transcriptional regulator
MNLEAAPSDRSCVVPDQRRGTSRSPKRPKTAMLLAQRIVRDIVESGLGDGATLPPERQMLLDYEVGRGTLRETMRYLELQGVVAIKPGPGGGPVVRKPDERHLAGTIALLLQMSGAPFHTIVEARAVLEPALAASAASRIKPEDLRRLGATVDNMREGITDEQRFLHENESFHDIIAWSSGNDLFGYLVTSLHWITDGTVLGVEYPEPRRHDVLRAHDRIYQAIADGNAEEAARTMREHIDGFTRYMTAKYPQVMDRPISWELVAPA